MPESAGNWIEASVTVRKPLPVVRFFRPRRPDFVLDDDDLEPTRKSRAGFAMIFVYGNSPFVAIGVSLDDRSEYLHPRIEIIGLVILRADVVATGISSFNFFDVLLFHLTPTTV